ncbi:hypothetical protein [Streptomyces sp. KL116D]|uniref:hypothetical protein n=1 Tax=Streptomyces sp. KL116D TaxID=3045152 RepID=UPI0035575582
MAWVRLLDGTHNRLCRTCLDDWFDMADDSPAWEPEAWGWLTGGEPLTAADITAALRDPSNRGMVTGVLRREARVNPGWLRSLMPSGYRAFRTAAW